MYGKTLTCTQVGNSISKAYQLKKRGKNKEDIYWEITPDDSTYIEQDVYTLLIDIGMQSDDSSHKLFTEACRQNMELYQKNFDTQSKFLYTRVDMIYSTAYAKEFQNYRDSFKGRSGLYRYGRSKSDIRNVFVTNESKGGLDSVSNEINNLVAERAFEIIYAPKLMEQSEYPTDLIPSLDRVRTQMAPDIVIKLVK